MGSYGQTVSLAKSYCRISDEQSKPQQILPGKPKKQIPESAQRGNPLHCPQRSVMASCVHHWTQGALPVPGQAHRRAGTRDVRRDALSARPPARSVYFDEVESFWSEVNFSREHSGSGSVRTSFEKAKEACWLAAYDAPFHGVPGSPYMHGRFADTNDHIAKIHNRFLSRSSQALCGHELSAAEFAEAVHRVGSVLNVRLDDAVRVVFGEPTLIAASETDIVRCLVELRGTYEGKDIASLVVQSGGALLRDAAALDCGELENSCMHLRYED